MERPDIEDYNYPGGHRKFKSDLRKWENQWGGGGGGSSRWQTQNRNSDATVRVSGGNVKDQSRSDAERTDFLVIDKTAEGGTEKSHFSIDTDGNTTVWKGNDSFGD